MLYSEPPCEIPAWRKGSDTAWARYAAEVYATAVLAAANPRRRTTQPDRPEVAPCPHCPTADRSAPAVPPPADPRTLPGIPFRRGSSGLTCATTAATCSGIPFQDETPAREAHRYFGGAPFLCAFRGICTIGNTVPFGSFFHL